MKAVISSSAAALLAACLFISPAQAQNVSIDLEPINPPVQIPAPGGSFDYNVTVSNTGASPQTFEAWIMVQLPDSSWYGPVLGPVNLTLPAGASIIRPRTQPVPSSAPAGTYTYEGQVGIYPSTIWNTNSITITKTLEGSELWVALYNGPGNDWDEAASLAVDTEGNVYVAGRSVGSGTDYDYATIKYDISGHQLWVARYNELGHCYDGASSVAVDGSGNICVTGGSIGIGTYEDYATIKYDAFGHQLWVARYDGPGHDWDEATSLAVDGNGDVYVTGYSAGDTTTYDYATIKYDASGDQLWVARYNGLGNSSDAAYALAVEAGGNVYVTGESLGSGTYYDYATIKYDASGNQLWVARYDGPGNDEDWANSLTVDGGGNIYVTGGSYSSETYCDYATIKYNAWGNLLWVARYNGPGNLNDEASSLAVDDHGNVYVTGGSDGNGTGCDYATVKYDANGNQLWVARYDGSGNAYDYATSLDLDGSGNVYVTGYCHGCGTGCDYTTIKYDSSGVQLWVVCYNGPGNFDDDANFLAVDISDNVYVTGHNAQSGTYPFNYDYTTIKYSGGNIANWQPVEALVFGSQETVAEYRLNPCYPNPFNSTTDIRYKMQDARQVSLRIYDSAGRLVTTLVDGWREAGMHELTFDAGDLPSGVYFCRMQAGEYSAVQKMMLVK